MMIKKEEKIRKKKKIILDALKRCLDRDVYSKITVQDIADEAGFSKGGVLHYFSNKEDIYLALVEDIFHEFEEAYVSMAPMSALVGVENFIADKTNIRIMINLFLYAFEEEKIMNQIKLYINKLRYFYLNIIPRGDDLNHRRKSDLEPKYLARIAQTVVLFLGLMETIDPIEIDNLEIIKYITTLLKG
jgi:AcrR family transcriptional regulator